MTYPSAPWTLQGYSVQTLHLLDIQLVRSLIPAELAIVPILPGKTLGGIYVATYQVGSTLEYNELIVVSGIVQSKGKIGAWISHIYVDNPISVQGGQAIWGLPKELAQFEWEDKALPSVRVSQDDRLLVAVRCQWRSLSLPSLSLSAPVLSLLDGKLLTFMGQGRFNFQLAGLAVDLPSTSPFAPFGFGQGWLSGCCQPLTLVAHSPTIVV